MKSAVVFLTKTPHLSTIRFAQKVKTLLQHDVFIVVDDNEFVPDLNSSNSITYIKIEDSYCREIGYVNSNISDNQTHIGKNPIAMDKFLLFFCENNLPYEFVWVFEDDVFIPSIEAFESLDKKYNTNDLVTPNNFLKKDSALDWHWPHIFNKVNPPYYYSMVCAMGVSKQMLQVIKEYVQNHRYLFYQEAMFNTLAMHNNLKVVDPWELKSIVWLGDWGLDEFLLLPNNLFHPIKRLEEHQVLRDAIVEISDTDYRPVDKLPDFVRPKVS